MGDDSADSADSAATSVDVGGYTTLGVFYYDEKNTHTKQENRLRDMVEYYSNEKIRTLLLPIITQQDTLSLRVLDWLVTHWRM